jgi:hypothetical protein
MCPRDAVHSRANLPQELGFAVQRFDRELPIGGHPDKVERVRHLLDGNRFTLHQDASKVGLLLFQHSSKRFVVVK